MYTRYSSDNVPIFFNTGMKMTPSGPRTFDRFALEIIFFTLSYMKEIGSESRSSLLVPRIVARLDRFCELASLHLYIECH